MILLAPVALWLSLVGGAVIALYLLKIKRQRQTVPSLEFWRSLTGPQHTRSLMQRLKRLLSLLLWLLILLLLILSIGNPVFTFGKIKPRSIIVVLDNSASMQTIEDDTTRLERAVADVRRMTSGRPVRDEWLLIESGRDIRVTQGWTHRAADMIDGATTILPHQGETDLAEAVALADQLLEGKRRPTIVVVSDGSAGELERIAASNERVILRPIGVRRDNVGITQIRVRPNRQRSTQHVFVRVSNSSDAARMLDLVLEVDGTTVGVEPIEIEAEGTWESTLVMERPEGGVLRAYLDVDDALTLDNQAFAIMPPIRSARVLLVSDPLEAFFFEQALGAMSPLVDVDGSATIDPAELQSVDWHAAAPDLVILNMAAPPPSLDASAVVTLNGLPAWTGARSIGELAEPRLNIALTSHPLMRFLELAGAQVARAHRVELTRPADVLVASDEGDPLVFHVRDPRQDTMCFAFDVLETDLPFRNSFPIMLRNAVSHLVEEGAAWTPSQVRVGEVIMSRRRAPEGVQTVTAYTLFDEEEIAHDITTQDGAFQFEGTSRPGPIRFEIGDDLAYAAVNVASERETVITPMLLPEDAPRLALSSTLASAPPWFVLGVLALVLVLFEWNSFHMRWTE